jgi:hypothetical protein
VDLYGSTRGCEYEASGLLKFWLDFYFLSYLQFDELGCFADFVFWFSKMYFSPWADDIEMMV